MAGTRLISVVGRKNAGKTTLVVALAQEFVRRGRRVGTLKHGHHPAMLDPEGTDTWRHFHEGNTVRTLIAAPNGRVLFERGDDGEEDPFALVRRYMLDLDVVIVEGYKRYPLPKIEVHRTREHPEPLYDPDAANAGEWIAMLTDDRTLRPPIPCFAFTDTNWFTNLAQLAWSGAHLLD